MIKLFAKYNDDVFITPCFESCDILNMLCGKSVQFDINNLFSCYSFCKYILKYLSRMDRVSLRTASRSMFLPVRTVSDASGLCKCTIKVPFVV